MPEEYWPLDACSAPGTASHRAVLRYGKRQGGAHSEAETDAVIAAVTGKEFSIQSVKRGKKQRSPLAPFITSTLQQEASRRLGMTPRRTMSIAQQLYEGVDVTGMGTVGLITYMRTDSLRLSDEAITAARGFIGDHYGEAYCPRAAPPLQDQGRRSGRARGDQADERRPCPRDGARTSRRNSTCSTG